MNEKNLVDSIVMDMGSRRRKYYFQTEERNGRNNRKDIGDEVTFEVDLKGWIENH